MKKELFGIAVLAAMVLAGVGLVYAQTGTTSTTPTSTTTTSPSTNTTTPGGAPRAGF